MNTVATKTSDARRPFAALLPALLMLLAGLLTAAPAPGATPAAHGTAQRLYVAFAEEDETSWIQYRTPEQPAWRPFAQMSQPVVAMTHVGGEVVILLESGEWRLLWSGGERLGPSLPQRSRILAIAGYGDRLFAIGRRHAEHTPTTTAATTQTTQPTHNVGLYRLQPSGWEYQIDLPYELDPAHPADVSLAVHDGQPIVAVMQDGRLHVLRLIDQQWQTIGTMAVGEGSAFKLLTIEDPILWLADGNGPGSLHRITDRFQPPVPLQTPADLPAATPRTITSLGTQLYLAFVHDGRLAVQAYNLDGTSVGTLDTVQPPYAEADPRISELIHLVVLAAMLFVLITTLRQRRFEPVRPENVMPVRLAPMSRRFAAGVIDLAPLMAAMVWIVSWTQGVQDPAETLAQQRVQLLLMVAATIYIAHTLIGEVFFGRSLGKWCLGLRLAAMDGHPPTPAAAVARNLLRIIDLVAFFPLPLLLILYTPLRQRIGDIAARTIVVCDVATGGTPPPADDEEPED